MQMWQSVDAYSCENMCWSDKFKDQESTSFAEEETADPDEPPEEELSEIGNNNEMSGTLPGPNPRQKSLVDRRGGREGKE